MSFVHLNKVTAVVEEIADAFRQSGHRLYLVGGIVRDQWLDHEPGDSADIDLTTDAPPDVTKRIVAPFADALWTQGERFGTIGLQHRGRAIEITTHRAESYEPDSRKPAVAFGTEIAVDLSRRDFTVNAMAIEVPEGALVDPWGGAEDLAAGRLRTPLEPQVSFSDDPLRMLRAARFAARFTLDPSPELIAAASDLADRMSIVAIERIGDEVERLLGLPDPTAGMAFLFETGLLTQLLEWSGRPLDAAERERMAQVEPVPACIQGPWQARLAGVLTVVHRNEERVDATAHALRLSRDDRRQVTRLSSAALALDRLAADAETDRASLRRWAGAYQDRSGAFAVASCTTENRSALDRVRRAFDELAETEDLDPPVLTGQEIMGLTGADPGPVVGEAVAMLRTTQQDVGPMSIEAQRRCVEKWWAGRRTNT